MKRWTTAIEVDAVTGEFSTIECDDCAVSLCAICGHEPCPACVDNCDHPECIVWRADGTSEEMTHECVFTPCAEHALEAK